MDRQQAREGEIAVLGAGGQVGDAVVRALLARGCRVRPVEVPRPDTLLDTLTALLRGASRLFATDGGLGGHPYAESAAGREVARAACEAGVEYVVYASAGGAERHTGVPAVESRRRVELAYDSLRQSSRMRATFLRPVLRMDDLETALTPMVEAGEVVVRMPLPPDRPLQLVAVEDVGAAAGALLTTPADGVPESVELGGDELTGTEIARAYGDRLSLPARFEELPLDAIEDAGSRSLWAWLAGGAAYDADRVASRALVPDLRDLRTWLREREPELREGAGSRRG